MNKGKLPLPGEDMETEMFDMLIEHMENKGRMRYEISNFAIPGYESTHNLLYWENETYAGIGAGAHGYVSGSGIQILVQLNDIWNKSIMVYAQFNNHILLQS